MSPESAFTSTAASPRVSSLSLSAVNLMRPEVSISACTHTCPKHTALRLM